MVGYENSDIAVFLPYYILYVFNSNRVNACKRLVEHDELRVDGKATGYLGTASLSTRKAVAQVLTHFLQVEFRNKAFEFLTLV